MNGDNILALDDVHDFDLSKRILFVHRPFWLIFNELCKKRIHIDFSIHLAVHKLKHFVRIDVLVSKIHSKILTHFKIV